MMKTRTYATFHSVIVNYISATQMRDAVIAIDNIEALTRAGITLQQSSFSVGTNAITLGIPFDHIVLSVLSVIRFREKRVGMTAAAIRVELVVKRVISEHGI